MGTPNQFMRLYIAHFPGHFELRAGTRADWRQLAHFHYLPNPPATCCRILALGYQGPRRWVAPPLAAVGILSWPVPCRVSRNRYFRIEKLSYRDKLLFLNAHLRTISRLAVHPCFAGLGLASFLVRQLMRQCPTPWIEASAAAADWLPLFERCGMTRLADQPGRPPCFIAHLSPGGNHDRSGPAVPR